MIRFVSSTYKKIRKLSEEEKWLGRLLAILVFVFFINPTTWNFGYEVPDPVDIIEYIVEIVVPFISFVFGGWMLGRAIAYSSYHPIELLVFIGVGKSLILLQFVEIAMYILAACLLIGVFVLVRKKQFSDHEKAAAITKRKPIKSELIYRAPEKVPDYDNRFDDLFPTEDVTDFPDQFTTTVQKADDEAIIQAAELLKSGEIVAIPTETVYGLAANALDSAAIHKIFAAKNRPANNPLIVHVSGLAQIRELGLEVPEIAEKLAEKFWPGALTIILRKKYDIIPTEICCGLSTVAVRAPDHPAAIALIEACEFPLAAPSANLSGSPSPTTAAHVFADLNGRIPLILDGGECVCGVESTVVALEKGAIRILRPGRVTAEQLREFAEVEIDDAVREKLDDTRPQSPGTAYKHYCPNAQVIAVIAENEETFRNYIDMNTGCGDYALSLCDAADMGASRLFARLRELDEKGAKRIFARLPEPHGIGLAVYNRIIRAAEFNVIDLGD